MIEVKGLYKDFGSLHVLRGVSLNVEQGDIISIIGPSGSGKSTLLRSINLLEKPTFGEIWVEGKLITPPDPYLHWDVIRASKTYGELCTQGMADEPAIIEEIKAAHPDILLAALGVPKQEKWLAKHLGELGVPVAIGVGGTFDVMAGVMKRAPRWMQRAKLEWLFRGMMQPQRAGRLLALPRFVLKVHAQKRKK